MALLMSSIHLQDQGKREAEWPCEQNNKDSGVKLRNPIQGNNPGKYYENDCYTVTPALADSITLALHLEQPASPPWGGKMKLIASKWALKIR